MVARVTTPLIVKISPHWCIRRITRHVESFGVWCDVLATSQLDSRGTSSAASVLTMTRSIIGYDWRSNNDASRDGYSKLQFALLICEETMRTGEHSGYYYNEYGCNSLCCNNIDRAAWQVWHADPARTIAKGEILETLRGFDALGSVGRVFASLANIGRSIASALGVASEAYATPAKGVWYKVTGSRGKAKAHVGLIGRCVFVAENTYGGAYYNRVGYLGGRTSLSLGLVPEGHTGKPIYVPAGQCTRIMEPASAAVERRVAEQKKAIAMVRPVYRGATGKRGDLAVIHSGTYTGNRGRVFWMGTNRRGECVGVKHLDSQGRETGEPLWCDARDVARVAPMSGSHTSEEIEATVIALVAAGFEAESEVWAQAMERFTL